MDYLAEKGMVTAVTNHTYTVAFQRKAMCGECRHGCIERREGEMTLDVTSYTQEFKIGDEVVVTIPKGAVFSAAFLAYGVPLIAFMAGIIAGTMLWSEGAGLLCGFGAGLLGFALVGLATRGRYSLITIRPAVLPRSDEP